MRAVRAAVNAAALLSRTPRVPADGEELRYRSALHLCVPADSPHVLNALLHDAYGEWRAGRYVCMTLGLDRRDLLASAVRGFMAQPTDVHAYVVTPGGPIDVQTLLARPLHYEIALV